MYSIPLHNFIYYANPDPVVRISRLEPGGENAASIAWIKLQIQNDKQTRERKEEGKGWAECFM